MHDPEYTRPNIFPRQPTEIFDWALYIPKVFVNHWRFTGFSILSECGIGQAKNFNISVPGETGFDIVGQDSVPNLPAAVYYVFDNGWSMQCGSFTTRSNTSTADGTVLSKQLDNGIRLISPEGTEYKFAYRAQRQISTIPQDPFVPYLYSTFYVTEIEDRFGNWIAFDWTSQLSLDSYLFRKPSILELSS